MSTAGPTVLLYRTAGSAPLLTTLAAGASRGGGHLLAYGPALHGPDGLDVADTIAATAASRGVTAEVWDGDAPGDVVGVRRLVADVAACTLVVEWQPRIVDGHLDLARQVLADPPCDVLIVRPGSLARIAEIAVAVGGGPNVPVAIALAQRWSEAFGVPARLIRNVDAAHEERAARIVCAELAGDLPVTVTVGRDLVNLLVGVADQTGFLALGATEGLPIDRLGVRTVGVRLAHRADATLVITRRSAPDTDERADR